MSLGDIVTAVLLLFGALFCMVGALGVVRLPDLPARLQAATKPQTLGLLLILLGTAVRLEFESAVTLVLVIGFQVITAPVISQIIGRSAYRTGTLRRDDLVIDELAERMSEDEDGGRAGEDRRTAP
ncbi:monovalent cation/H(+) antiporter subunit G [Pseudonocardia bannensis]|uniref:Monovalent cation/H(+) antiporter subunit G n=1 Tax=Pseudonocardia bannensis TaxID=630973 RepID=A0A848DGV8_9PSEU|nr:monovalent cation/H(+) antiporter subunit G [Pseudonocardia bannensis]NMH91751.1 monovalent cation/H(+) antiporter subunit G [Pseudonocardia bannensis]